MSPTRRVVLAALGASGLGCLAGCFDTSADEAMVTIDISNATDEQRKISLEILPVSADTDRSENTLFERWITLGPSGTESATEALPAIFESEKALIRVGNEIGVVGEYTFVPDCPRGTAVEEAVRIYVTAIDSVAFDQNTCG